MPVFFPQAPADSSSIKRLTLTRSPSVEKLPTAGYIVGERRGGMSDRRHDAMRHAVDLARTGKFNNWWSVIAWMQARRYREADVAFTPWQREWLDCLCKEARCPRLAPDASRPFAW